MNFNRLPLSSHFHISFPGSLSIFLLPLLLACGPTTEPNQSENSDATATPATSKLDGAALSKVHCSSCHLYPEPKLLDKSTWENFVLIRMGAFMGIYFDGQQYYDQMPAQWIEPGIGGQRVKKAEIYPKQAQLSRADWLKIKEYYLNEAPATTEAAATPTIQPRLRHFKSNRMMQHGFYEPYVQSMAIDAAKQEMILSLFEQNVVRINQEGIVQEALGYNRVVTDIDLTDEGLILTAMGNRNGLDTPTGLLLEGQNLKVLAQQQQRVRLDSLQRPVSTAWEDLNGDGRKDLVLAEFGNYLGQLSWYEQLENGGWNQHILLPENGALKVEIADMTGDGLPDIVALMGNSDEGIDLYQNEGNGQFTRQRLLRFLPTNGSTDFELVDFDQDGQLDLLYANGDNGDYPPILKSHHGIRLFRNTGNLQFEESFSLPQNGVYQVRSHDFDRDGDLDIASVAYHPDFRNHPEESFVYWEQTRPGTFRASTFPEVGMSRWMRIEVGDLDQDGDEDIILGAFNAQSQDVPEEIFEEWAKADLPLIWLENTVVK